MLIVPSHIFCYFFFLNRDNCKGILAWCLDKAIKDNVVPDACDVQGYFLYDPRRAVNALGYMDRCWEVYRAVCSTNKVGFHCVWLWGCCLSYPAFVVARKSCQCSCSLHTPLSSTSLIPPKINVMVDCPSKNKRLHGTSCPPLRISYLWGWLSMIKLREYSLVIIQILTELLNLNLCRA